MGPFVARLRRRHAVAGAAWLVSAVPLAGAAHMSVPVHGSLQAEGAAAADPASDARHRVRIEGTALLPGGGPARGAVVVSSAGGQAAAGEDGSFALELAVDPAATAVELTAVANGPGGALIARRRVGGLCDGPSRHAGTLVLAQSQGCEAEWIPAFGGAPGTNDLVHALTVFDDGSGPALYAGGAFTTAGGQSARRIAKWDGQTWSALGSGMNNTVLALTVFDDGSGAGPALYAGGFFGAAGGQGANHIARWDGQGWSALGAGLNSWVNALTVFDDGSGAGPALYAAGQFTAAGGLSALRIAKWDGQGWSALSNGLNNSAYALTVFDDGSGAGPALYVGGFFTGASGQSASRIARWDGQGWSTLGSGVSSSVYALAVFDDGAGAGPALYAAGTFTSAGGQDANRIARWDGQGWSSLASGLDSTVSALAVLDDGAGAGPALYAGGYFTTAGGQDASRIARWDGQAWSALGAGMNDAVRALTAFDDGSGTHPVLYAGGEFTAGSGQDGKWISRWDGQGWSALGSGINDTIEALTVFDDGSGGGRALYAGGSFTSAGGQTANRIARWDGRGWSALASGLNDTVRALTVFDDGSGAAPALYAGGSFTSAGGQPANRIARWDGQGWTALDTGVGSEGGSDVVSALAVFDDGSGAGPALYAGGRFAIAGAQSANQIAKWDGQGWSALASGLSSPVGGSVSALAVFDDGSGSGPALFAGGDFTSAGGQGASSIARWDGLGWSALASGMDGPVRALAVFDDGSGAGPALYAGGDFATAGGQDASRIARWDGQAWSALASGMSAVPGSTVSALAVFDDGSAGGPALYAGGSFTSAGGLSASNIARWDGQGWSALASGMSDAGVTALTVFDEESGAGPGLYAGGPFHVSPGGDSHLARWACPAIDSLPGCLGNPAALASLSGEAVIGGTFAVSLSASRLASGQGLLYFGLDGTDAAGCGLLVTGLGELLLALAPGPAPVASGHVIAGSVGLAVPVPPQPAVLGVTVAFQGVVLGVFAPGVPIELSNALSVTITQ